MFTHESTRTLRKSIEKRHPKQSNALKAVSSPWFEDPGQESVVRRKKENCESVIVERQQTKIIIERIEVDQGFLGIPPRKLLEETVDENDGLQEMPKR